MIEDITYTTKSEGHGNEKLLIAEVLTEKHIQLRPTDRKIID